MGWFRLSLSSHPHVFGVVRRPGREHHLCARRLGVSRTPHRQSAASTLRVFLEAAQNDNTVANVTHDLNRRCPAYYGWLTANQNMAAALKAKGYHYRYVYAAGAGHADGNVMAQTLPEELLLALARVPPSTSAGAGSESPVPEHDVDGAAHGSSVASLKRRRPTAHSSATSSTAR